MNNEALEGAYEYLKHNLLENNNNKNLLVE